MKQHNPIATAQTLLGAEVKLSERCCGEAGSFAAARPDIATQVRFRKAEEIQRVAGELRGEGAATVKLLTSCPSCLQGLSRYEAEAGVEADYLIIEMARHRFGEEWMQGFIERVNQGGIERVLL